MPPKNFEQQMVTLDGEGFYPHMEIDSGRLCPVQHRGEVSIVHLPPNEDINLSAGNPTPLSFNLIKLLPDNVQSGVVTFDQRNLQKNLGIKRKDSSPEDLLIYLRAGLKEAVEGSLRMDRASFSSAFLADSLEEILGSRQTALEKYVNDDHKFSYDVFDATRQLSQTSALRKRGGDNIVAAFKIICNTKASDLKAISTVAKRAQMAEVQKALDMEFTGILALLGISRTVPENPKSIETAQGFFESEELGFAAESGFARVSPDIRREALQKASENFESLDFETLCEIFRKILTGTTKPLLGATETLVRRLNPGNPLIADKSVSVGFRKKES